MTCEVCRKAECSCLVDAFKDTVAWLKTPDADLLPVLPHPESREELLSRFAAADGSPVSDTVFTTNRHVWLAQTVAAMEPVLPGAKVIAERLDAAKRREREYTVPPESSSSSGRLRDYDLRPERTWSNVDAGRFQRNRPTHPRHNPDKGMPQTGKPSRVKPLVALQIETNGDYRTVASANASRLAVCRICRQELPKGKRAYCSKQCENVMEAARARAARSAPWTTRTTGHGDQQMHGFSLDSITVAGIGKLEVSPEVWNRLNKADPVLARPEPQPWFVPNRTKHLTAAEVAQVWNGSRAALRLVYGNLLITQDMLDTFQRENREDTRTPDEWADRLARRYGTGGTPPAPCARFGCQEIPAKRKNGRGRVRYCSKECRKAAPSRWAQQWFRFPVGWGVPRLKAVETEPGVWECVA